MEGEEFDPLVRSSVSERWRVQVDRFWTRRPSTIDVTDDSESKKSSSRDELRTIAFRLREIQRLLAVRAAQENRRLEAEGLEPVTDDEAFKEYERAGEPKE